MKIEVDGVTYLPAVDISELPTQTFTTAFSKDGDSCTVDSLPFVMLSDLRKVAIRNTERETELEADLKEMADACLAKQCKIVELEAELSTLREHQGMVGKKLTKGSIMDICWYKDATYQKYRLGHFDPMGGEYYEYTGPRELPLPTLPEPEESSLVKRLKSLQCRASGSYDDHVRVDSGTLAQVLKALEEPKE